MKKKRNSMDQEQIFDEETVAAPVQQKSPADKKAEAAHKIWAHWMKYMLSESCKAVTPSPRNGAIIIPKESIDRWLQLANTDFDSLSDQEKKSDYEVASLYLEDL